LVSYQKAATGTNGGSAKVSYAEPIPKGSHRPSLCENSKSGG